MGYIDFENAYDRVNRKTLWQVLRMYDVGGKLLSGIKNMHVDSSACVRVKGGESEQFRIESGMRQGCTMSPWLFIVYMDERDEDEDGKKGSSILEVRESGDWLAFCTQMTWFHVVSRRRT